MRSVVAACLALALVGTARAREQVIEPLNPQGAEQAIETITAPGGEQTVEALAGDGQQVIAATDTSDEARVASGVAKGVVAVLSVAISLGAMAASLMFF